MEKIRYVIMAAALLVLLGMVSGCAVSGHKKKPFPPEPDGAGIAAEQESDQKRIERYEKELSKLAALIRQLQERNALLSVEIRDLKRVNACGKNLLDLQDRVLQLLDDKHNTVRTLLTEEARKLNLPTKYPEDERTYFSYVESDLFERDGIELHAKGRNVLMQLCDEIRTAGVRSLVIENHPCKASDDPSDFLSAECTLSAARAAAVAQFLSSGMNREAGRIFLGTVISLGPDSAGRDTNAAPERRIDVVLELTRQDRPAPPDIGR